MNAYAAITLILVGFFCFALLFLLRDIGSSLAQVSLELAALRRKLDIERVIDDIRASHRQVLVKLDTQDLEKLSRR